MQRYTVYLYLETAVRVSGGTSTHHQEHIQLYLQHLVFVTPLMLPAAIPYIYIYIYIYGIAIPLQAWTGPEVSRSLRLPDFETIGT